MSADMFVEQDAAEQQTSHLLSYDIIDIMLFNYFDRQHYQFYVEKLQTRSSVRCA